MLREYNMKESLYDKYKLKRLANGLDYLSEDEFTHLFATNDEFVQELISMGVIDNTKPIQKPMPSKDVDEKKVAKIEEGDMGLLVGYQRCEECHEVKEETEFAGRRGGKRQKVCKTCMGQRISNGHKKSAKITEEQTPDKAKRLRALTPFIDEKKIAMPKSTLPKLPDRHCDAADAISLGLALHVEEKVPLLKEQPVIKAISDKTLRSMIVMAYKRGFDEGKMNAIEPINHDDAMAFVEHYLRGCEHE